MRISNTTRNSFFQIIATAILTLGLANGAAYANNALLGDNYEWSAQLISFDESNGTAVFKARVESYVEIDGLHEFEDGDRLILSWTGRNWAAGIRGLASDPELEPGTLTLPVEFVATELDGQYVHFRVAVPEDAMATMAAMDIGARVTGVSPKEPADWGNAIISLRHYNDVS